MELLSHINQECKAEEELCNLAVAAIQARLQPPEVPAACQPLLAKDSDFAVKIMTRLLNPQSIKLPEYVERYPGWYLRERTESLYWSCVSKTKNPDIATVTPIPQTLKCNFTIVSGDGQGIECHDWILYARWPYFRHLVCSGLSEIANHRLELPSDTFPFTLLQPFIQYLYTHGVDSFDTDSQKLSLLRHAPQFNLVDLSTPPLPDPHFKRLISHCRQVLNEPCTIESCVTLYKAMAELGSPQQLNTVGRFILDHFPTLSKQPSSLQELKKLGVHSFGEMWLRARGCDPTEFSP